MHPDIIILVMGMTGSGKSSFVKLITGDNSIKIGHGVASQTFDIGVHYWTAPDGRLCALVDTPGFDDSNGMTDTNVLRNIARYLEGTYGKINGLVYCQRIDVRAGGLTIRNLKMFEKVCGLALKNAILMTTHWDAVGNERAVRLQQQLVTGQQYFKPLCDAGASTFGHDNTRVSAQRVMDKILSNNPIVLQIQEELKTGMTLEQTAAGSQLSAHLDPQLSAHLEAVRKTHEWEMQRVRAENEAAVRAHEAALAEARQRELSIAAEAAATAAAAAAAAVSYVQPNRKHSTPRFFRKFGRW